MKDKIQGAQGIIKLNEKLIRTLKEKQENNHQYKNDKKKKQLEKSG